MHIPVRLRETCSRNPEWSAWLERLPEILLEVKERWSLTVEEPFDCDEVTCSWVAPVRRRDGSPAVLKLGMPHMEGEHEIHALRFWNGDPAVLLYKADEELNAMLMERCEPGTMLRTLPGPEQDAVMASVLRRLWRLPPSPHPFRPLAEMTAHWSQETLAEADRWPDPGLVREGLRLFEELARPAPHDVLLATDLHAGNVLRAERQPWLVIDPKPFIGDPAYDATQHLLNDEARLCQDPHGFIRRFADLLEMDETRIRLWLFARLAAESRDDWDERSLDDVARVLAP